MDAIRLLKNRVIKFEKFQIKNMWKTLNSKSSNFNYYLSEFNLALTQYGIILYILQRYGLSRKVYFVKIASLKDSFLCPYNKEFG